MTDSKGATPSSEAPTPSKKRKVGFALNPQNINRGGRKKGSKNRKTMLQAQLKVTDVAECAAATLEALMKNDKDFLGTKEDVPTSVRYNSAKELLSRAGDYDKEDKKDKAKQSPSAKVHSGGSKAAPTPASGPQVFSSAK